MAKAEPRRTLRTARGSGRRIASRYVVVLLALAWSSAGFAQTPAVPVMLPPKALIGTDYPFTLESGYGRHTAGGVVPVAFTAGINGERLAVLGSVSWLAVPNEDVESGIGGGVALDWQATPFRPDRDPYIWRPLVRARIGAAWSRVEETAAGTWTQIDVPIAVGLGWVLPANALVVTPWVAPRAHVRVLVDVPDSDGSDAHWGAGLSAGIEVFKANCAPLQMDCSTGLGGRLGVEALAIHNVRTGDAVAWSIAAALVWRKF